MAAIDIAGISKTFGSHLAVDDLSLSVDDGSIYGFIGPNGSGKTTTLRMIMNILLPDRGTIHVLGRSGTSAARDDVGYLPEERGLYRKMTVGRLLHYYGALKGATTADIQREMAFWLDRLDLTKWRDQRIEALSKGMSQKVQLIATVIARPKVVILDEPFSGLDPVNANVLRDGVLELRKRGATIVFSTHDMAVAEQMCDRIFMIFKGRKVLDGTLDEIQARYGHDTVRVRTEAGRGALDGDPAVEAVSDYGNLQEVRLAGGSDPQALLARLAARTAVTHFEVTRPSLHDIFVRIAQPGADAGAIAGGGPMIPFAKVWTVARTEFLLAIRSKAFLIGVALLPTIGAISVLMPKFAGDEVDKLERKVAIVDPSGRFYESLFTVVAAHNARMVAADGSITGPRFHLERAGVPPGRSAADVRIALSDRVRSKELFAFAEMPTPPFDRTPKIRYYTDSPTFQPLPRLLEEIVGRLVIAQRLITTTLDPQTIVAMVQPPQLERLNLVAREADGRVGQAKFSDPIRAFVTPMILMGLMFLIVISTASPLLNSVMEEKMTRISEVLLGSLSPFELMAGKLLGVIGVAMVLSVVYLSGAYGYAAWNGYGDAVTLGQVVWFIVYLVLAMLIYGSLFIAIGSAATDLKDAQALMTPCMLLFMAPIFVWMPIIRAPASTLAVTSSLVPFATPVLMTLRMALTPAPPAWQVALGFVLTLATTVAFVWAGGRIFRTGILMQGKSATFAEMWRWVRTR